MKSTTILSVSILAVSAAASTVQPNVHAVADLVARAIDPATMDPTKLSVLSVLKTAIPTATGTNIVLPTGDVMPQWYKDLPADVMVLLVQMHPATATAAVSEASSAVANISSALAQGTFAASQTTLTRTMEQVPTATANSTSLSTGPPNDTTANGTLSTSSPSPTRSSFSTGAKNAVGAGQWSVLMGASVAVCFFLFA